MIGAGSAGAVVSRRLVEAGASVVLLEAGGEDTNPAIHEPGRVHERWGSPEDWNYDLRRPGVRFLSYGLAGWTLDSFFVWAHTGRRRPSSLLNVPVYGLAQPLFEPVHDRIRRRPVALRAAVYGTGVLGVEYACGRLLRRLGSRVPWDYRGARFGIDGLVRLDYLPLWAAYGLGLERLHDLFTRRASE